MKLFKHLNLTKKAFLVALVFSFLFLGNSFLSAEKKEINKSFKPVGIVEISMVSGDCDIMKGAGNEIKVHIVYDYPPDIYEPILNEEGDKLILKEKFNGSVSSHGDICKWTVTVPENTKIDFTSASGDLKVEGLKNSFSAKSASGDITLTNVHGELTIKSASGDIQANKIEGRINFKSASGDIKLENVKGDINLKSASGDIHVSNAELNKPCSLESASGDVQIILSKSLETDLNLASVSGDINLDFNGAPIKGYFEFHGKIDNFSAPFSFEKKEDPGHFGIASFKAGADSPKITLKTVSGDASIEK